MTITKSPIFPHSQTMAEVEILSLCLVRMANDSCPITRLELTPWDLLCLQADSIQRGLVFTNPNPSLESPITFINHLKTTFSQTLDYFPPLAGRLVCTVHDDSKTSFHIDCNNAGAEFTHAVASTLWVSDLVEPKYSPDVFYSLFPLNRVANFEGVSKPLLGVQVTQLVDGFFVACSINHSVVDGTSFWHFFNSWAELSRGLGMISKLPIFKRCYTGTCLQGKPIPFPPLKQYGFDDAILPPFLQRFFHFSSEAVAKLKVKANSEAGTDKISSTQVVIAHLWRSIVRSRRRQRIGDEILKAEEVSACVVVGTRPRFPLPDGYFGNAAYGKFICRSEDEILEDSLGNVAAMINELVGQQSFEVETQSLEKLEKNPAVCPRFKGFHFVITGSSRHNVYGCDFGWGKPVTARSGKALLCDGKMVFFPTPEPGGIDVEVCLQPETMKIFEDDPQFLKAFSV